MKRDEISLIDEHRCLLMRCCSSCWEVFDPPFIVVPMDCFSTCTENKQFRKELKELLCRYFNPNLIASL